MGESMPVLQPLAGARSTGLLVVDAVPSTWEEQVSYHLGNAQAALQEARRLHDHMLERFGPEPVPVLQPGWLPDSAVSHCGGCRDPFTWFNRKHHFRQCGGIYCRNCTKRRVYSRHPRVSRTGMMEDYIGYRRMCWNCKSAHESEDPNSVAAIELRHNLGY